MRLKQGSGRIIGGLILIVLGVLFLLSSLDVLDFDAVWEAIGWIVSIVLIATGGVILIAQRFRRIFLPIVLITIGIFILLGNLAIDAYQFWPVILIVIGGAVIFGRRRRRHRSNESKRTQNQVGRSATTTTTTDSDLNIVCTLGETNERVESTDFSGGRVNVTMGNVNLDLRGAYISSPPARLDVNMTMGGLKLRVPSDWVVSMENVVTMAESEDKRIRPATTSNETHLVISGKITMGSLVVED